MTKGRSVRLYLVDGTSTGIVTAEIMNWTGHALSAPRIRLEDATRRDELKRTGVYILISDTIEHELPIAYVGETDHIAKRLNAHAKDNKKDFWTRFVAFTSKDMNLTKAHVKYLESQLIELLYQAKKCKVDNDNTPKFDRLPEADIADMDRYLDEIQLILPVLGIDIFRKTRIPALASHDETTVLFKLVNTNKRIDAKAVETDGIFVVLKGSKGSLHKTGSFQAGIKDMRDRGLEAGRIHAIDDAQFELMDDFEFSSPSAAAVFLYGTSRNGRTDWIVDGTGVNYGEWKNAKIEQD
jgi:hypothetical protein